MTAIAPINTYTGTVPSRGQARSDFNNNTHNILEYIKLFGPDLNLRIGEINTVAGEVSSSASDANDSAVDAASSAAASASSANAAPYNPATTYNTGDRAIGSDSNTYGCLNDSVTGDNPVGSTTGNWVAITVLTTIVDFILGGLRTGCRMIRGGVPSDGGVLDVDYTAYVADVNGAYYPAGASSITLTGSGGGNELRFVYVNSSGVMTGSATAPTGNYIPVAIVYVTASDIVSVTDWRVFAQQSRGFSRPTRPRFEAVAADTQINIVGPGQYKLAGVGDVWFNSTLAYDFTTLAAGDISYLYIDASTITTGPGPIDATSLIDSLTEPSYDAAKGGYYNGEDLCIMAVRGINGASYEGFYHDGGEYVEYDAAITDRAASALSATETDEALTIPAFSQRAQVLFIHTYVSAATYASWRRNGSSATTKAVTRVTSVMTEDLEVTDVYTDLSQLIEVKAGAAGSNLEIRTNGFYFGKGM